MLLIIAVSFPVAQPDEKKEANVRLVLITYEVDVPVQESLVAMFLGL